MTQLDRQRYHRGFESCQNSAPPGSFNLLAPLNRKFVVILWKDERKRSIKSAPLKNIKMFLKKSARK